MKKSFFTLVALLALNFSSFAGSCSMVSNGWRCTVSSGGLSDAQCCAIASAVLANIH